MQHISEVLQDTLITKGITSKPPLSEARKREIKKRLKILGQWSLHPMLSLVIRDAHELLAELERKEAE